MNVDALGKQLHKDFRRVYYPQSMGYPEQNKEGWIKETTGMIGFATGFDTIAHSIIETPGRVVIHATNEMKNSIGLDTRHESIYIVHIVTDDDGSLKIKKLEDFCDSKVYSELRQSVATAIAAAHANK